ncbi:MAG: hypothetical protein ABI851_07090 [Saprospiraceae bacterium]
MSLLLMILHSSCSNLGTRTSNTKVDKDTIAFINNNITGNYWYQGKGEINSFYLEQARYGQIHKGEAVLVFVTEDFSKTKQVKLDRIEESSDNQPVFKLNMMKRFNTGICTYSLMLSVFNPIGSAVSPHPLKITSSIQDWCGQVFSQLNQKENKYILHQYSYFEQEADKIKELPCGITEDEIWNQIRINPQLLPIGEHNVLPGNFYTRLKHKPTDYLKANLSLKAINDSIQQYSIQYDEGRNLQIDFYKEYPYNINSWKESYMDGEEVLTTRAIKIKSILIDYWKLHQVEDSSYRALLGLKY